MKTININIAYEELQKRKKRWDTVMGFERPDRVPVIQYIGSRYWLPLIGYENDFSNYFNDPVTMMEAQLEGQKWILENIKSDFHNIVVYPDFMWVEDVSAFGAETTFPKNDSPWVSRPHMLEKDDDLEKLRDCDYVHSGLHGKMIDYYKKMKDAASDFTVSFSDGKEIQVADLVFPGGAGVIGIAALAGDLCGVEKFSMDMYDKPEWVKELLDIIVDKSIDWIKAVLALNNGRMAFCSDYYENIIHIGDDGTAQMSPDQFQEFMIPAFKKLVSYIHSKECAVQAHNCGKADHLVKFWKDDLSIDRYMGFSYLTDKHLLKDVMGGKVQILGGIDTAKLHEETPEAVFEDCKNNLEIFKDCAGYVMMDGHNIAPGTPVDNINAMYKCAVQYGSF